jgi:hypothetical protein
MIIPIILEDGKRNRIHWWKMYRLDRLYNSIWIGGKLELMEPIWNGPAVNKES